MKLALLLVLACHTGSRPMPKPAPELDRVDVFGSKQLTRDQLLAHWGSTS